MKRACPKVLSILFCGALVCSVGGGCLPSNLFANLTGDMIGTAVNAIFTELLNAFLNQGCPA